MSTIHVFASTSGSGLHAFAGDAEGSRLPPRHGPWKRTGSVPADRDLPHAMDRAAVEAAIEAQGFQMWRVRAAATH